MTIALSKGPGDDSGSCKLTMNADMTIYSAQQIHQELVAHAQQFDRLELDLSAVEDIDCSGIQLLLAMQQRAEREAGEVRLVKPSTAVVAVMELLALRDRFEWDDATRD